MEIGLSVALPMQATADEWHHDHPVAAARVHHQEVRRDREAYDAHHHFWQWRRENDHYRAYPYTPTYAYGAGPRRPYYGAGIPANGAGMIDPSNHNLMWACDTDGHHCHWAPRF